MRAGETDVNLIKVFLLTVLLATGGAALGGFAGTNIGPGGLLIGGFLAGTIFVVVGGFLSAKLRWIKPDQRLWCILGAGFGFALAWMVALATIMTPGALLAAAILAGVGAVLGAVVGVSPHSEP
jgi:hypothetical protein